MSWVGSQILSCHIVEIGNTVIIQGLSDDEAHPSGPAAEPWYTLTATSATVNAAPLHHERRCMLDDDRPKHRMSCQMTLFVSFTFRRFPIVSLLIYFSILISEAG
jgi:hypothetical protein